MIVVTGSTGHVGGEAARLLIESGVPIRLIVRDAVRAAHFGAAEITVADYNQPDAVAQAVHAGDTVFMVSVYETHDERLGKHEQFVRTAADAGAGRIVYLSFINSALDADFIHAVSHFETEQMIRDAGVPFTFLRTSLYQAAVPFFYVDGHAAAPAGTGSASWVSRRDIGAAVAAVLRDENHAGETYELTGPEALTMQQTSERVNSLIGTTLTYDDVDDLATLGTRGLPDPVAMKESRRTCFTSIAIGQQSNVTDHIERLTGIPASPIDRHALNYPEQFRNTGS
jgi:uncharacterized protein YbjT (DUF2867 family)